MDRPPPDEAPQLLRASAAMPPAGAFASTSEAECYAYEQVSVLAQVNVLGAMTRLDTRIQFAAEDPGVNWMTFPGEVYAFGTTIATLTDFETRRSVLGAPPGAFFLLTSVRVPAGMAVLRLSVACLGGGGAERVAYYITRGP